MTIWKEPNAVDVPDSIQDYVGGRALVAETLIRRGYTTIQEIKAFLSPVEYQPVSPYDLSGMATAVDRIKGAITRQEMICVWGDFDVDGQSATTILLECLRNLNARVVYHIPVRKNETHGINLPVLGKIILGDASAVSGWKGDFNQPGLLITCDTGISSTAEVEFAQQHGLDVIITDHHHPPQALPEAVSIINPRLPNQKVQLATLPGAGVAYKLAEALYGAFGLEIAVKPLLELVALGIVADVAGLVGETRYLLQLGLEMLRNTHRPGLLAILERAELEAAFLNEELIGFELAPRLNAIGRLGDANLAVELLTTDDIGQARLLAAQVETMNNERKLLTSQVTQAAVAQIDRTPQLLDHPVLILAHPTWPASVLGIVASRLVDRYQKPVILIATPPGSEARGSARSIKGLNIILAMQSCAEVFSQFGGHAGAAGFSMDPQRISELHRSIDQAVLAMGPLDDFVLQIDGTIAISGLSLDLVDDLERLAPFGAGNPPLVLMCPHLRLVKSSPVGKDGEHFSVLVEDEAGNSQQVIWWHGGNRQLPQDWFDLALTARSTTFQGKRALQVEWIDFRPVELDQASPVARYRPEIIDYRDQAYPFPLLEKILAETHSQVWAEGEAMSRLVAQGIPAVGRTGLVPGRSLVIWTAPASPGILAEVILGIKPEYIYLFALPPETERLSEFTRLLAGLVKYKMNHQNGVISIPDFAIRMAQLEITILKGIHLLEAMGHLEVVESKPGELVLRPGGREDQGREKNLSGELDGLLKEAKSYRAYLSRINIQTLIDSLVPG